MDFIYAFGMGAVMSYILTGEKISMENVRLALFVGFLWPVLLIFWVMGVFTDEELKKVK